MKRKVVYVGFAFQHHKDTHAGYHQIKEYLNYDYVIDCQGFFDKASRPYESLNILSKLTRRIFRRLFGFNNIPWFLFRIIWLGIRNNDLVFHYIYGENIYFPWTRHFMRKGNKIVCTFHQPLSYFESNTRAMERLLKTDFIILVGNSEVEQFKRITGKDDVVYIPHGISTDFYNIDKDVKKEPIILTVGNWLRDYEFANKVYSNLLKLNSDVSIHIVSSPSNMKYITKNPRITFMHGISDEELRLEYLKCSVLFLPLKRYTANNSLLEASSTGCNIVIASNYSDNSYIPEKYITLSKMDVIGTTNTILKSYNYDYNEALSEFIKNHYGWELVASKTYEILKNV